MERVKKVVITGGPVAGKTTAINHLKEVLPDSTLVVPEVATMLLSRGYPMPGRDLEWTPEWQEGFQDAVFHIQGPVEHVAVNTARQKGGDLVLTDRGLLDGAAYFTGGRDEFAERFGLDIHETMVSYDAVVHLESLAVRGRSTWDELRRSNPSRFRPYEEVVLLEYGVREAWEGHPNRIMVNDHSLDDRLLAIEGIVRAIQMPSEMPP